MPKLDRSKLVASYMEKNASEHTAASRLASMAKSAAKSKWGSSMQFLGPHLRDAVVAYEFASIVASQEPMEKGSQSERIIQGAIDVMRG